MSDHNLEQSGAIILPEFASEIKPTLVDSESESEQIHDHQQKHTKSPDPNPKPKKTKPFTPLKHPSPAKATPSKSKEAKSKNGLNQTFGSSDAAAKKRELPTGKPQKTMNQKMQPVKTTQSATSERRDEAKNVITSFERIAKTSRSPDKTPIGYSSLRASHKEEKINFIKANIEVFEDKTWSKVPGPNKPLPRPEVLQEIAEREAREKEELERLRKEQEVGPEPVDEYEEFPKFQDEIMSRVKELGLLDQEECSLVFNDALLLVLEEKKEKEELEALLTFIDELFESSNNSPNKEEIREQFKNQFVLNLPHETPCYDFYHKYLLKEYEDDAVLIEVVSDLVHKLAKPEFKSEENEKRLTRDFKSIIDKEKLRKVIPLIVS